MTLSSTDFFQRWLRHVPAPQSRVVRFYGLYHHTHAEALVHCRAQVGQLPVVVPVARDWQTACAQRGEAHPERYPAGGQRLVCMGAIPRGGAPPPPWLGHVQHDAVWQADACQTCAWRLPPGSPTWSGGHSENA